jgi:two-component system sensor histidine kinase KdpD
MPVAEMPDTHVPSGQGWLALAKSSLKGAFADRRPIDERPSLVMVGLMGTPPWFRPDDGHGGWFAKFRILALIPFGGEAADARKNGGRAHGGPTNGGPATGGPAQGGPRAAGSGAAGHVRRARLPAGLLDLWAEETAAPRRYGSATALVALAAGVCWLLQPYLLVGSLVLPFLIAIMLTAIAYGLLPSLFASVLGVLTFDFFFLPPLYSLDVSEPDDVLRLGVFATAALIVSNLAAYARAQALTASLRAEVAEDLYRFGRQLAGAATLREVLESSLPRLTLLLRAPVLIVLPDDGNLAIYPAAGAGGMALNGADQVLSGTEFALSGTDFALSGTDFALSGTDFAKVKSWLQTDPRSGADVPVPISTDWLFVPMRTGPGKVGMMAVGREALDRLRVPNTDALFGTLADLLAQAVHRIDLADDLTLATRAAEREALHAALLASLSHDLRTPLSSVMAAAESLAEWREMPGEATQQALARSIQSDARRLDRYIGDLLDMTRLESGLADATGSRIDVMDAISVALDRCANLATHRVDVEIAPDLPLLAGDEVLLEHVLFNLLDNAAKYTPAGSTIMVRAAIMGERLTIEVSDEGDGIRPADLERIFDKFYRGRRQGPQSPGIGLGLAICRGYVEAMGGRISARNRTDRGGAVFTIGFPIPETEDLPDLDA